MAENAAEEIVAVVSCVSSCWLWGCVADGVTSAALIAADITRPTRCALESSMDSSLTSSCAVMRVIELKN